VKLTISSPIQVHGVAKVAAKRALDSANITMRFSKELGLELNEIERLSASGVIAKPAAPGRAASEIRSRSTFSEMSSLESLRKR
jgi:hypothetical protein